MVNAEQRIDMVRKSIAASHQSFKTIKYINMYVLGKKKDKKKPNNDKRSTVAGSIKKDMCHTVAWLLIEGPGSARTHSGCTSVGLELGKFGA